jgi:hypothetical protein
VAPKIETAATRRQLLEYRVAFDVDGALLVDADRGRVSTVTFPRLEERVSPGAPPSRWLVVLAALALAAAALVAALAR